MDGLTRAARRLGPPGPIAFVVAGLALSAAAPQLQVVVTPELVLVVLLPGLVFEAAYRLHWEDLRRSYGSIAFLAVPGVLLSAAVVAVILSAAIGLPAGPAFVVGAIVSATDPAAVVATFAKLRAPRRLIAIVDAESLLNDGTALVAFAIAVAAVTRGVGPLEAAWLFGLTIAGSALIGALAGLGAALAIVRARGRLLPVMISLLAAYGTYLAAAAVGLSGVLASVLAGIVLGNYGRRVGLTEATERALDAVWEPLAAALTALIFLAVGIAIGRSGVWSALVPIAWGLLAVLLARALVVYGLIGGAVAVLGRGPVAPNLPVGWLHPLFWAGLRGGVATAAALSLPLDFPERELLQRITFGIVVVTLVVQGSTAGWIVRRVTAVDQPASTLPTT
ncbi:MAG TPA: cation:proton antiporter [Candidatus Limnocylindria bacterium]